MPGLAEISPAGRLTRIGFVLGGLAVLAAGAWCCRGMFIHHATAQQVQPAATGTAAAPGSSDYTSRVVAYLYNGEAVTRQDLGEYLLIRHGAEKLPLLINKRLVDEECQRNGIQVTAAEIEAAFAEDLKGMGMGLESFVQTVLTRYKKTLYEWKEDVLRPRLQMTHLVGGRVTITAEDVQKAYEATYGEKVECRVIIWPITQNKEATQEYARLRDSEAEFAEKARKQHISELASTGGKIKPIARHTMDAAVEAEAFKLQPGQCSTLILTPQGITMLRCDRRIPADTAMNREAVRPRLEKEIREGKLQVEMAKVFQALRDRAKVNTEGHLLLKQAERMPQGPLPPPTQIVAYLHGTNPVTREELGEFLINRYGAEKLEFLVNRKIIEKECASRNIAVTDEEVEEGLKADLKMLNCDETRFKKELLGKWGKNILEWREDVVRAKMLLTRLCQNRVKVTDEDLKKGYEAYYGERLACRVILWPQEQRTFIDRVYPKIRDSEEEFAAAARNQQSPTLATRGGVIDIFGKHTLGDEDLEREAFKLHPGEVSHAIGTRQGWVVIKCDRRMPPDTKVKFEQVKDRLMRETHEKKVQIEMQVAFKELREKANPRFILKPAGRAEDLLGDSKKLLQETNSLR